uniref:Uncharacterized protein n=1 Tax=Anguilla anguilla TaxID=7936 RepID=A0A0E9WRC8_ANGAN
MCGMTPPPAIVALMSESNSSSPRIASCKWRGVIRFTFKSLEAFPANSRTSAVRYSRMAALYTAAVPLHARDSWSLISDACGYDRRGTVNPLSVSAKQPLSWSCRSPSLLCHQPLCFIWLKICARF